MHFVRVMIDALPELLTGIKFTAIVTIMSLVAASIIGLVLCFMTLSRILIMRGIATTYINIIRGVPLLVQILFVYFGIPSVTGAHLPAIVAGTITMSAYVSAYMAEIFRAGIQDVDRGQTEAGEAVGLTRWQVNRLIVLPQAIRGFLPAYVNQVSMTIKDTSLLSVIGIAELTFQGQAVYSANFETFTILFEMAILYFIMIYSLTLVSRIVERKLAVW